MRSLILKMSLTAVICGSSGFAASLVEAVKSGRLPEVQKSLQSRANPNEADSDGTSALLCAVEEDRLDIVKALIAAGANVNAKNHFGAAPLALALMDGSVAIAEELLKAGADPKTKVPELGSALLAASHLGSAAVIEALLKAGVNVNETEPSTGQTPLMRAAAEGHEEAVRKLLKAGADYKAKSTRGETALFFAVRAGCQGVTAALLEAGADVNERASPDAGGRRGMGGGGMPAAKAPGDSMLVVAILNAHFRLADFLLSKGADPNSVSGNWTPLHSMSRIRNYEEMQYPPPVVTPGEMDSLELAKHLLERGANPNVKGATTVARRVGGDQNYKDLIGATPFFLASKSGDVPYMRLLLKAGANPATPIDDHTTPLMVAAGIGCVPGQWVEPESDVLAAVKMLVEELKADVNATNDAHETAVHGAVCRGADSVIQYLVDKGARLDVKDEDGQTPLDQVEHGLNRAVSINGPKIIIFHSPDHTIALVRKLTAQQMGQPGAKAQ
jgi:ankyrin repeat protein